VGWRDGLARILGVSPAPAAAAAAPAPRARAGLPAVVPVSVARAVPGGRVTVAKGETGFLGMAQALIAPADAESDWRLQQLDQRALERVSPARLIELLCDVSPDVSRALWDFLRMCNPGYEVKALRRGTPRGEEVVDERGPAALDAFLERLTVLYGSLDVVFARLFIGAFLRGGLFAELVLDAAGRVPVDLATPDPATVRFKRVRDDVRGTVWQLGQTQGFEFVPLERPTVRYIPLDPFPDSPYGRAVAAPTLFSALFLIGMLHDLRRVVQQQGYPRLDLAVVVERIQAAMPDDLQGDGEALKEWVDAAIAEVQTVFAQLKPDDVFVHTDAVTVGRPVGAASTEHFGAFDGLIDQLVRLVVRGSKSMPLLAGITDGVSEANANRQWEIHVAGIKSVQHLVENLLSPLLTLALEAQGIPARGSLRFAELRAAEEFRDQQTLEKKLANADTAYKLGYYSQEEASLFAVGHPPDQEEPRAAQIAPPPAPEANPEPGADRARRPVVVGPPVARPRATPAERAAIVEAALERARRLETATNGHR
jgi:hypothetical protein